MNWIPYKPIESDKKAMTIQVVALQWKWLFIYPEEKIATVNFVQFPKDTPIHFEITADAPMNSFWIPHLGGQIYAMPKMKTELHLIADEAEISEDLRPISAERDLQACILSPEPRRKKIIRNGWKRQNNHQRFSTLKNTIN